MDTACKYSRLYIYGLFLSRYLGLWRSIMFMSLYPLHLDMKLANFGRWWGKERPGMLQSRGCKKLDMTGQLNNNPLYWLIFNSFLDIYQLLFSHVSFTFQCTFLRRLSLYKAAFFISIISLLSFMLWCLAFFVKRIFFMAQILAFFYFKVI